MIDPAVPRLDRCAREARWRQSACKSRPGQGRRGDEAGALPNSEAILAQLPKHSSDSHACACRAPASFDARRLITTFLWLRSSGSASHRDGRDPGRDACEFCDHVRDAESDGVACLVLLPSDTESDTCHTRTPWRRRARLELSLSRFVFTNFVKRFDVPVLFIPVPVFRFDVHGPRHLQVNKRYSESNNNSIERQASSPCCGALREAFGRSAQRVL